MFLALAADVLAPHIGLTSQETERLLEIPPDASWGDAALPCFQLARQQKRSPADIAAGLAASIQDRRIRCSAAGPYLNVSFVREGVAGEWLGVLSAPAFYTPLIGGGERVAIDMSSPNIAKPFGIGHLRSTVIGNALNNILSEVGYEVLRINHLGDWGTQFGKQIAAYCRWGDEEALRKAPIDESLKLYVRFHKEAEHNPELEEEGRYWFAKLEAGDAEARALWEFFVTESKKEFRRIYDRLGVSFEYELGESFYNDKMVGVIERLRSLGLLEESDGALVVRLEEEGLPPCLIVKSDGTSIYATRDLATAIYRAESLGAERLLYVVGAEQSLHFRQVFAVLRRMGFAWAERCEHVPFGLMRFEGKKMSTRKGSVVFLDDVLDEAVQRAADVIRERSSALAEREAVAEAIGVGAVLFGDLKNDRLGSIDFSLDEALRFEGDTGPYVQYTNARIQSLIGKAADIAGAEPGVGSGDGSGVVEGACADSGTVSGSVEGASSDSGAVSGSVVGASSDSGAAPDYSAICGDAAWALLKELVMYPSVLARAAELREPSLLAKHLLDVAKAFNRFYHAERVLAGTAAERSAKLLLCERTGFVLQRGLALLGIKAPPRM
ncbi:arginine--tRNA ligase [Paenibacillus thermotolerans]|uniref:arginine--tRNA ligase n=1 Tax=Paenibacillus thermotolerans TaxID=3027807 RepID=UPI002367587F|nr:MULTISPECIES: arginine--tRNA ligase [unclassified Paenibacillus]